MNPTLAGEFAMRIDALSGGFATACLAVSVASGAAGALPEGEAALAAEVHSLGWIVFSARSGNGSWDISVCRPDGADQRFLTDTPDLHEFSPLLSPDGSRLLYRRIPKAEVIDNNRHGEQGELMLANRDVSHAQALGKPGEFSWASWSPDGKQIASLSIKGVSLIDLATLTVKRTLPRKGFFQQMTWSPDGQWLCGVANSFGASWSVARIHAESGQANAINVIDCCTPDWFPDSQQIIFSWRPPGQKANKGYGWTELWRASADGKNRELVYGEEGRHVYGGNVSPDGKYVLFTGNMQEDGDPGNAGGPMGLMRLGDGPIIRGESRELRQRHPDTRSGPVLVLPSGWEPIWTRASFDREAGTAPGAPAGASGSSLPKANDSPEQQVEVLRREIKTKGWLAFSDRTEQAYPLDSTVLDHAPAPAMSSGTIAGACA
jgi:hypothetical protein